MRSSELILAMSEALVIIESIYGGQSTDMSGWGMQMCACVCTGGCGVCVCVCACVCLCAGVRARIF